MQIKVQDLMQRLRALPPDTPLNIDGATETLLTNAAAIELLSLVVLMQRAIQQRGKQS